MTNTVVEINNKVILGNHDTDIVIMEGYVQALQGFIMEKTTFNRVNVSMSKAMIIKLIKDLTELL